MTPVLSIFLLRSAHCFFAGTLAFVLPSLAAAQETAPIRQSHDNSIVSEADPPAVLQFGKTFHYVGAQVIDIAHVAGAEQHFLVDAAPDSSVRRFYWIQFEHYYPSNQHTYDYSAVKQQPVPFGIFGFLGDIDVVHDYFNSDEPAGADYKAAGQFLRGKGYTFHGTYDRVRLFYLTDSSRRKELMVIYGEVVPAGGSKEQGASAVIQHAQENLKVERPRAGQ